MVMAHGYQREYVKAQLQSFEQIRKDQGAKAQRKVKPKATKASLAHVKTQPAPPKEPFKLKQFANVAARVKMG